MIDIKIPKKSSELKCSEIPANSWHCIICISNLKVASISLFCGATQRSFNMRADIASMTGIDGIIIKVLPTSFGANGTRTLDRPCAIMGDGLGLTPTIELDITLNDQILLRMISTKQLPDIDSFLLHLQNQMLNQKCSNIITKRDWSKWNMLLDKTNRTTEIVRAKRATGSKRFQKKDSALVALSAQNVSNLINDKFGFAWVLNQRPWIALVVVAIPMISNRGCTF